MKTNLTYASALALALLVGGAGVASAYTPFGGFGRADLTDEQQGVFQKMHDLRIAGNNQEAQALAQEMGFRGNRGLYRNEHREEARTAVDNNDYTAFQAAVEGSPMEDVVTPEIFSKMVEAHNLRDAGDLEGAREVMQGLGIGKGEGVRMGGERRGRGFGEGNWNR